jgi:pSer/pThr/pTyr-binding forkhead associated (FHA) protein
MHPAKIVLTVTQGALHGKEFIFKDPALCTIGRADDCEIQMPGDLASADISRHHCLLEIDPPAIRVRDLGSKNGTFVNGKRIEQNQNHTPRWETTPDVSEDQELKDGDELRLGHTLFRVGIVPPDGSEAPMYFPMGFM